MLGNFNDEAVTSLFDSVVSWAMLTGRFDQVNQHEPTDAPRTNCICSIWIQAVRPIKAGGLAATTGIVEMNARIYMNFKQHPHDFVDPRITSAAADFMGALSGDFDFGEVANVRMIDLLGAYGPPLQAQAGYIELDRQMFRVMTVNIPVVVNDMFAQEA
jgi:hypothetical protein